MPRVKCLFKELDVRRALKAADDAGKTVTSFQIDQRGKITVVFAPLDAIDDPPRQPEKLSAAVARA